ncbi:Ribonuclease H-like superfamily [Sesbania bispinosa]|nr:Ribonuclease H-like superfamily [Sesbania bispinosa]
MRREEGLHNVERLRFANPSLSVEEDLLHRSTKKSKVDDGPPSVSARKVVSYKDVCLGINGVDHDYQSSEEELGGWNANDPDESDESEADPDEMEEENKPAEGLELLCPTVQLLKEEKRGVRIPWKRALIVKLLGKRVGLRFMQGRLMKLWQPQRRMKVIDLDNDYFVIRFADWGDLNKVLEGGPWVIMGHYLVIQRWKPEFLPYEDELKRVSVCIRIPELPIEYYDNHVLWRIGDVVGRTVKVDANTSRFIEDEEGLSMITERGKFARICVEVDLRKILISRFKLNGRLYSVEYEGLNLICFNCGCFDHRKENYPLLALQKGSSDEQVGVPCDPDHQEKLESGPMEEGLAPVGCFGPWMMVQRKNHPQNPVNLETNKVIQSNQERKVVTGLVGSRFNALRDEVEHDLVEGSIGDMVRMVNANDCNQILNGGPQKRKLQKENQVDPKFDLDGDMIIPHEDNGEKIVTNPSVISSKRESLRKIKVSARGIQSSQQQRSSYDSVPFANTSRALSPHVSSPSINLDSPHQHVLTDTGKLKGNGDVDLMDVKAHISSPSPTTSVQSFVMAQAARPPDEKSLECAQVDHVFVEAQEELKEVRSSDTLLEPRVSGKRADSIIRKCGFQFNYRVDASGFSGGIWILWNDTNSRVEVISNHPQFVHLKISPLHGGRPWFLICVYASPRLQQRRILWHELCSISDHMSGDWAIWGDFNSYLHGYEKQGGGAPNLVSMNHFRTCTNYYNLLDGGFNGPSFTWAWRNVKERLDRLLCNGQWRTRFDEAVIVHLPSLKSDHKSILLRLHGCVPFVRSNRPFRFFSPWIADDSFKRVVEEAWQVDGQWNFKVRKFQEKVLDWNANHFGNIFHRKRRLLARMEGVRFMMIHFGRLSGGGKALRKLIVFCGYMVVNKGLKTRSKGFNCGLFDTALCPVCQQSEETTLHVLRDCAATKEVWRSLGVDPDSASFFSVRVNDWFMQNLTGGANGDWRLFFALGTAGKSSCSEPWESWEAWGKAVKWCCPDVGWIKFNVDGSMKFGSSHAGCRGVMRDYNGIWLGGFSFNIGSSSVLMAELRGIIFTLNIAWERGFLKVWIESDSLTAVELINKGEFQNYPYAYVLN